VVTQLSVVEAYLPDVGLRDEGWYRTLLDHVSASLAPHGLEVGLLVLPDDETVLWLINLDHHATARAQPPSGLDLPGLIAAATAFAGGHVVEREMNARLVRGEVAGP
jgi:hypothetical protein